MKFLTKICKYFFEAKSMSMKYSKKHIAITREKCHIISYRYEVLVAFSLLLL